MNQHFNLSRFGRLLRKHTAEHLRSYLMSTAVLAGGLIVVLCGLTYITHRPLNIQVQTVLYMFLLLAAGAVFTSSAFAALGNPRQAAPALMLPASHLEKYLVVWLYTVPVFLVVFTAAFLAVDALALQLLDGKQGELLDFTKDLSLPLKALLSYLLIHAVALWSALYFNRLHAVKMAFALFGVAGLVVVINYQVLKRLIPADLSPTLPFSSVSFGAGQQWFRMELPESQEALLPLLPLALAVLLCLGAYSRLTEKQL
ncbi:hypothetical protein ACFQT0_10850 [Hymenobacter humi]|uniref:ABC transporter permease n=1 Tax=Hymenobacter humi TaxID=1411620 RepID=A0ABW2U5X3_9BACT